MKSIMDNQNNNSKTKNKHKKKGPIRTEALIPIFIILVLFTLYFKFYFDSHLRYLLQYGATQAHGAEVNIASVNTNFLAPSLSIHNIQVTDKGQPELNIVQIGEIRLQLLWDALLRGKFVIPESSILHIQAKSKRKHPGRILPATKSSGGKGQLETAANEATEKTLNQLEEKNKSNLLADVFSVAGGTNVDDQLKKMEDQIQSEKKIKALREELKNKETQWKQKIDELPKESELKQLVKKIEGLKIDTKNPQTIQQSIKQIDSVYQEAKIKYKTIEDAQKTLKTDINQYKSEYSQLEKLVQEDINHIARKLNLPSLDPKEINQMLLGNLIASQLKGFYRYKNVVREYMPTKSAAERKKEKDEEKAELTPVERAQGVNYHFPKKKSYPKFWLKKAEISSTSEQGQAGDLSGTLANLTDNPRHLGIPTTFDFKGGFPHQKIMNVTGNITIDHTTEIPKEKGELKVGSYPISNKSLTKSEDVELGYNKADGSSRIGFILKNHQLEIDSQSLFKNVEYYSQAKNPKVAQLLSGVTQGLDDLTLNIKATGSWQDLNLNINSNLGRKLSEAIKNQISGEINKARKQVEQKVRSLVDGEKNKIKSQLAEVEKKLGVSLKSREEAMQSVTKTVENKKKQATQKGLKNIENKAKDLLKKIKF